VSPYRLALVLVAAGSSANSVNGLLLRSIEAATEWQLVFYRSASLAVSLTFVYVFIHRRDTARELAKLTRLSLAGSLALSATNIGFIWSVQHTTVANTMFMLGAIPFLTAILARVFLKELVSTRLWCSVTIAMGGVSLMVWDGIGTGTMFGNALALFTAVSFATYIVILRRGRSTDMLPVVVLGAWVSVLISSTMANFNLVISWHDIGLMVVWGGVLSALVHFFFTYGSRHVQGAELSLFALLEFALAPIWVLIVFDERPSDLSLVGGTLVMLAVLAHAIVSLRPRAISTQ
jgi:drug/metabolite transporter (DMT)-like permease